MPAGVVELEPEMHLHPHPHGHNEKSAGEQKDADRLAELGYTQVGPSQGGGAGMGRGMIADCWTVLEYYRS